MTEPATTPDSRPAHLRTHTSDRGLVYLPALPSEYGGDVAVSTASNACGPRLWLRAAAPVNLNEPEGPTREAAMNLTAFNAARLAEQLLVTAIGHYQHDGELDVFEPRVRELMAEVLAELDRIGGSE